MAYLRFGEEFSDDDLVGLFRVIDHAEFDSSPDPDWPEPEAAGQVPDELIRELISVMQARGIGDREELASMLVELDDRARPSRPKPFRPGTMLAPMPRVTINIVKDSDA